MSLTGNATATELRGKINSLDVLCIDAYEIAVKNGFEGTEEEWLQSLKGEKGDRGSDGKDGKDGRNGIVDYTMAANALKGRVEGSVVAIKDASPFKQVVPIKGNMLPDIEEQEKNGVTVFRTGDGGFVINGTVEEPFSDVFSFVLDAGDYTLCANNESTTNGLQLSVASSEAMVMEYIYFSRANEKVSFSVGSRANFTLHFSFPFEGVSFKNFKFNPILAKDDGEATITKYGKNLLDLSQTTNRTRCTYNAETNEFISNITDSYYCSITTRQLNDILLASKGKPFTFSVGKGNEDKGTILVIYGTRTDGKEYQDVDSGLKPYVTVTVAEEFTAIDRVTLRFNQHATKSTDTTTVLSDFQFEFGDTATEYEPYVEPTTLTGNSITMKGEGVTLFANNGETLTAEYSRDINKAFAELLSKITG